MIEYKPIANLEDIARLWNQELGFIYPISERVFHQNISNYPKKIVYGAYDNNILVGFIVGKTYDRDIIDDYKNYGWITIFYVAKKYRRQGIGSALLKYLEDSFAGKQYIFLGKDIFNFFPGIPCDFNNLTDRWFMKRGYTNGGYTHDLINQNLKKMPIKNKKYKFCICTLAEKDSLLEFMKTNFPGRWYYEVYQYFEDGGDGNEYVIALDNDKVIAFARANDKNFKQIHYNITWYPRFKNLGGIGPLGVDNNYRGHNLGYDIVAYGINTLMERQISEIIIDWTGLLEFYQQFGFEVWKSFKYMSKKG